MGINISELNRLLRPYKYLARIVDNHVKYTHTQACVTYNPNDTIQLLLWSDLFRVLNDLQTSGCTQIIDLNWDSIVLLGGYKND